MPKMIRADLKHSFGMYTKGKECYIQVTRSDQPVASRARSASQYTFALSRRHSISSPEGVMLVSLNILVKRCTSCQRKHKANGQKDVWTQRQVKDRAKLESRCKHGIQRRIYSRSLSVEWGTATASARITEIVASCDPSSRKASIWIRILSTTWQSIVKDNGHTQSMQSFNKRK